MSERGSKHVYLVINVTSDDRNISYVYNNTVFVSLFSIVLFIVTVAKVVIMKQGTVSVYHQHDQLNKPYFGLSELNQGPFNATQFNILIRLKIDLEQQKERLRDRERI